MSIQITGATIKELSDGAVEMPWEHVGGADAL